jgi:hypothetical protein
VLFGDTAAIHRRLIRKEGGNESCSQANANLAINLAI